MKRWLLITGLVALMCAGVAVTVKYCHSIFHGDEVSEIYLKYKDVPGVEATFVKGFLVTDGMRVDITLLRATDTASWIALYGEYCAQVRHIQDVPEQYREVLLFGDGVSFNSHPAGHPEMRADSSMTDVELAVIYVRFRTVMICHTNTFAQTREIYKYQINDYFKNIKQ